MKVIEILKLNKGMLKTCRKVGIRMEDVQYIELYNDYPSTVLSFTFIQLISALSGRPLPFTI